MGRRELAFGLLNHALRSLGVPEDEARRAVQGVRTAGEGGAFDRRSGLEPARGVPELRPHRGDDGAAEPPPRRGAGTGRAVDPSSRSA
jgi:CPA2 family monovalent cation:H+ antiporter-2